MKRIVLSVFVAASLLSLGANAQQYRGGLPWSLADQTGLISAQQVPTVEFASPDFDRAKEEDKIPNPVGAYRVALPVITDLNLQNSGTISYLQDGSMVWRLNIRVPKAMTLSIDYNRFFLPKGVALYLTNANGKQLLGSFTYIDNCENYGTPLVQGEMTTLEMNIPAGIKLSDVDFSINTIWASYRGELEETLNLKYNDDADGTVRARPTADPCHVNAICAPWGQTYNLLKNTAAFINMGGYICSGNLINNAKQDCTPYFITASHCESTNSMTTSTFNSWKFYFNYEYTNCTGGATVNMDNVLTGADFVARAPYNPNIPAINGDFILLKLKDPFNKLGNQYSAYLGGWDRATSASSSTKYIDFHHPGGAPKKVTVFTFMSKNGSFNGGGTNTHWSAKLELGGIEGGSSGSAVFSMDKGRIFGVLSGGPSTPGGPCDTVDENRSLYSKISHDWEYTPGDGTSKTRLKDHLDPDGTDVMFTNTMQLNTTSGVDPVTCSTIPTGVDEVGLLEDALSVYPNPAQGLVFIKANLYTPSVLNIDVLDISGRVLGQFTTDKVKTGEVSIDLSGYSNGMYMLRISSDKATVGKKIVISK